VNDDATTLRSLIKRLGRINIHPYYVYLCDMVKATEHFRLPLRTAQRLEKEVRGTTAGFNTPLFIVDTPSGKRDVHSAEFHDSEYGVSGFMSPAVSGGLMRYYFDPIRSLSDAAAEAWASPDARKSILAAIAAKARPSMPLLVANGAYGPAQGKRMQRSPTRETTRRPSPHQPEAVHAGTRGQEPLHVGVITGKPAAEAHNVPPA
jgi:lysine 2,3-aminomutase